MNFESLLKQIDAVTASTKKKTYEDDGKYWRQTKDSAGNGQSVIRFLPSKNVDDVPFVRLYTHSFKNPKTNRWYIENSLSTIGEIDYIAEMNRELWNSGIEEDKNLARKRARKANYIANIYVVKDPAAPENEGKVFLFKFGKKIFDKIVAAAKPDEDLGEDPVNVFDPDTGADFSLRQTVVSDFPNYDQSKFGSKKPLAKTQKAIDDILEQCHDVNLEIVPDKFKTKEELKSKFLWVNGEDQKTKDSKSESDYDEELDELTKIAQEKPISESKPGKAKTPPIVTSDEDDSDAAFFASLVD